MFEIERAYVLLHSESFAQLMFVFCFVAESGGK